MTKATLFSRFQLCPILLSLPLAAATCDSLASLKLPNTTITAAQVVAAGALVPPSTGAPSAPFKSLPAFCRVQGVIAPSSDSHIEFEVWMPLAGWNGRRSEEHTSELQSHSFISYALFCFKKK